MLRIRREQVEAFRREAIQRLEDGSLRHVRTQLPDLTHSYTKDQVRQRVRECIPREARYRLVTEQQIMIFVDATFLLGDQFDTAPEHDWTIDVLWDEALSADEKADLILDGAVRHFNGQEDVPRAEQ